MQKYKAVIFDLDGTLVNTLHDIAECTNYALRELSLPEHPIESYRLKVGCGNRALVSSCLAPNQQHLLDAVLEIQLTYYTDHFCDHSRAYPGIPETLYELKSLGLKLAVLSNKPAPFTPKVVERVFGDFPFDVVRGPMPDVPLKPDPSSALSVAESLAVSPAKVAFVGDSGVDMKTARNASMFAVGVTWGFRDRAELEENGSQAIIDHPSELCSLLRP